MCGMKSIIRVCPREFAAHEEKKYINNTHLVHDSVQLRYTSCAIVSVFKFSLKVFRMDDNTFVIVDGESGASGNNSGKMPPNPHAPTLKSMHFESTIRNRYARTIETCKYSNPTSSTQQTTFSIILPDSAFIAEFVMEIEGKKYEAYVKEKEQAKKDYEEAIEHGQAAAHVALSARDSNKFTVSVNVQAKNDVTFFLTYEELLTRKNSKYEMIVNLHPGQYIDDLGVDIYINESRPIINIQTPALKSGNEITEAVTKNEYAFINKEDNELVHISFHPTIEQQKSIAKEKDEGISGQFVVEYDVERDPSGGEVLINDGYFVHFFAPTNLEPIPKHVIFVLDVSGSMQGRKLEQVKKAMKVILNELNPKDYFNLVKFSTSISVLDNKCEWKELDNPSESIVPPSLEVNKKNIESVSSVVDALTVENSTNIYDALVTGLRITSKGIAHLPKIEGEHTPQPIIVFLTDGQPNEKESNPDKIIQMVESRNDCANKTAIFSLAFGDDSDENFLKELAMKNSGFLRIIYEASDAALQLQDFYKQISSPLLTNITFKYTEKAKDITKHNFDILFDGSEFVVVGKIDETEDDFVVVDAATLNGTNKFCPSIICPKKNQKEQFGNLERLWAYMTIKQLLDKKYEAKKIENNGEENKNDKDSLSPEEKQALSLALKYSFVTPVTSLVVVRPDGPTTENNLENSRGENNELSFSAFGMVSNLRCCSVSGTTFGGAVNTSMKRISGPGDRSLMCAQKCIQYSSRQSPRRYFSTASKLFSAPIKLPKMPSILQQFKTSNDIVDENEYIHLQSFKVNCQVENNTLKTEEVRKYQNSHRKPQEEKMVFGLPDEKTIIKDLLMKIGGQVYKSNGYEKLEDANKEFELAISKNLDAIFSSCEEGKVTLYIFITSKNTVTLIFNYEKELDNGGSKIIVNLNRDGKTNKMEIDIHLKIQQKITNIEKPIIKSQNKTMESHDAIINQVSDNEAFIKFYPTKKERQNMVKTLNNGDEIFSGQFIVEYQKTGESVQTDNVKSNSCSVKFPHLVAVKGNNSVQNQ